MAADSLSVTMCRALKRALGTNNNDSAFTSKVPTITEPASDGVQNVGMPNGGTVPQYLLMYPIGLGSDNDAFSVRIYGWRRIGSGDRPNVLWVPSALGEYACTISSAVGVTGSPVLATERFADTITVVSEPTVTADVTRGGTTFVYNPANNTPAYVIMPLMGVEKVEFVWDQTTGTPTMNALIGYF